MVNVPPELVFDVRESQDEVPEGVTVMDATLLHACEAAVWVNVIIFLGCVSIPRRKLIVVVADVGASNTQAMVTVKVAVARVYGGRSMTTLTVWMPMWAESVDGPTVITPPVVTASQEYVGLLKA